MSENDYRIDLLNKIKGLTNEIVEKNGKVYVDYDKFLLPPNAAIKKKLSSLIKTGGIDRNIVNYLNHKRSLQRMSRNGESTMLMDREVSKDLSILYKKISDKRNFDALCEWFDIFDEVVDFEENMDILSNNRELEDPGALQIDVDDWHIPDEEDEREYDKRR